MPGRGKANFSLKKMDFPEAVFLLYPLPILNFPLLSFTPKILRTSLLEKTNLISKLFNLIYCSKISKISSPRIIFFFNFSAIVLETLLLAEVLRHQAFTGCAGWMGRDGHCANNFINKKKGVLSTVFQTILHWRFSRCSEILRLSYPLSPTP